MLNTLEDPERMANQLNEELGLTPYESKAYIALLLHGPLTPQGVNQKSGIPRPRTYDVLNSLVGKGLLMEQPGRPRMYAAVDPQIGLEKAIVELEKKVLRELDEKRKIAERLSASLSKLHDKSREAISEQERIWVTRRDRAFISRYCEAIRGIKNEFVVATPAPNPPEREVLEAVRFVLRKKKTVRVVRQISHEWTTELLDAYEKLIMMGDQVRYLDYSGLRFAVFDRKETLLVLPPEREATLAVWIRLPSLAEIMYDRFEALWKMGQPMLPVLRKTREEQRVSD